MRLYNVTEALG